MPPLSYLSGCLGICLSILYPVSRYDLYIACICQKELMWLIGFCVIAERMERKKRRLQEESGSMCEEIARIYVKPLLICSRRTRTSVRNTTCRIDIDIAIAILCFFVIFCGFWFPLFLAKMKWNVGLFWLIQGKDVYEILSSCFWFRLHVNVF